jgi:hypothetical protein
MLKYKKQELTEMFNCSLSGVLSCGSFIKETIYFLRM